MHTSDVIYESSILIFSLTLKPQSLSHSSFVALLLKRREATQGTHDFSRRNGRAKDGHKKTRRGVWRKSQASLSRGLVCHFCEDLLSHSGGREGKKESVSY